MVLLGTLVTASLLALVAAYRPPADSHARRHHDIARRASGEVNLHKRAFSNSRWTFYDVGLGACGEYNKASDYIVALNSAQFGGGYPGPNCFKSITLSYKGKTVGATIMDECPTCPYGALDLSRGLFANFGTEDDGVVYGSWWFNDGSDSGGGGGGDDHTTTKKHTTTKAPEPTPTTTKHTTTKKTTTTPPPEPTTTEEPETTSSKTSSKKKSSTTSSTPTSTSTTSSSASSTAAPSSSINYSSGVASGLAVPTGTVTTDSNNPQVLALFNNAVVNMGGVIVAGAEIV